jgi:transcriptional regulator with XRE-family HTH domain
MVPLAQLRRERNMTQAELAARLGVSANTVTRWEMDGRNAARPNVPTLRYLASVLGVDPGDIDFGAMGETKRAGRPPRPGAAEGERG